MPFVFMAWHGGSDKTYSWSETEMSTPASEQNSQHGQDNSPHSQSKADPEKQPALSWRIIKVLRENQPLKHSQWVSASWHLSVFTKPCIPMSFQRILLEGRQWSIMLKIKSFPCSQFVKPRRLPVGWTEAWEKQHSHLQPTYQTKKIS